MGLFGFMKQSQWERQSQLRAKCGITQSSDSDVRCVECRYVTGNNGTSTRECRLHGLPVNTSEVCSRFQAG